MDISEFRVRNYKSILDSGLIALSPNFNVIVGQNNSGKSSLVEALSSRFTDRPHRSVVTIPRRTSQPDPYSQIDLIGNLADEELHNIIVDARTLNWAVLQPAGMQPHRLGESVSIANLKQIHTTYRPGEGIVGSFFGNAHDERSKSKLWGSFEYDLDTRKFRFHGVTGQQRFTVLSDVVANRLHNRVYSFRAERMNIGRGVFGHDVVLQPDAQNLPTVLALLQSNPERVRQYNHAVSTVFPEIQHVSVDPDPSLQPNGIRIQIWTLPPASQRDDLAVPLLESGTGISQVLAILYVVQASTDPQTIIVDEPQSFLHPGAARKLIEVLKQYPRHQFVFTTHSATIINAAEPETILLLRKTGSTSVVEKVAADDNRSLRTLLSEVGARLTDVFGADNILWVEGPTEELCLPLIIGHHLEQPLYGTQIVGVARTGDFEGRHADLVLEIYEKLTVGPSLLPPAFGFMFDREDRSEEKIADLHRRARGRITFSQRRMYENYVLIPEAIAGVASAIPGFRDVPLTSDEVQAWLNEHGWDRRYWGREIPEVDRTEEFWRRNVHGANILKYLFADFSENRVEFDKVRDSVALTRWVLSHRPDELREFADSVSNLQAVKAG